MESTVIHVSPLDVNIDIWANLLRRHVEQADIVLDDIEEYLVVCRYDGPLVIPSSRDFGVIVASEGDAKYFLEHKKEILTRAAELLSLAA